MGDPGVGVFEPASLGTLWQSSELVQHFNKGDKPDSGGGKRGLGGSREGHAGGTRGSFSSVLLCLGSPKVRRGVGSRQGRVWPLTVGQEV